MFDAAEKIGVDYRVVQGIRFNRGETAAGREVWTCNAMAQSVYFEPHLNPDKPFRVAGAVYANFDLAARNAIRIRKREVEVARKIVEDYDKARFQRF